MDAIAQCPHCRRYLQEHSYGKPRCPWCNKPIKWPEREPEQPKPVIMLLEKTQKGK